MARVTYVKKAQQRYETVPVIDPATGEQKRTPVINRRTGEQKTTKNGRLVFLNVTEADKSKPLPNHTCEKCGTEIKVGDPYKHVSPKSGPYGGRTRYRCDSCPTWKSWELSSSKMAEIYQAQDECGIESAESYDDARAALGCVAEAARSVAEQYRESAENIESGFGHETYQSQELAEKADEIEGWADELESWEPPNGEEFEPDEDDAADENYDAEQAEQEWRDELISSASDLIQEAPG